MTDMLEGWRLLRDAAGWAWWSWVASRWSGGGPGHRSYPEAKFNAYVYGTRVKDWLRPRT